MSHADLMTRLENSSANESSHELACRCQDARKALAAADVRVAELEAEFNGACICRFNDPTDDERPTRECDMHAALRKQVAELDGEDVWW